MKVEVSELSSVKRSLRIEVPQEVVSQEFARAYKDLRKRVKIPGFRPGKAPHALLERRYSDTIAEDVVLKLIPDYSQRAVEEMGMSPVLVELPPLDHTTIKKDQSFCFTTTVEVKPRIEIELVTGLPLKKRQARAITPEDEEKALEALRLRHAELHSLGNDHESIVGDYVSLNVVGKIGGNPVERYTRKGVVIRLGDRNTFLGKELDPSLIGRRKGDVVTLSVSHPQDARHPEVEGKTVDLLLEIGEIKELVLPTFDDEFAADLGAQSLDDLRTRVRRELETKRDREIEASQKEHLLKYLVDTYSFEVPPSLLESEISSAMQHIVHTHRDGASDHVHAGTEGGSSQEQVEKLRVEVQDVAMAQVKSRIILDAIAEKEHLVILDDEVNAEYQRLADSMNVPVGELRRKILAGGERAVERLKTTLLRDKALHYVYTHAIIQD